MKELGLKLGSFSDRLVTQKSIYLFQVMGFDLGYRYSWYLRGPYSPALTADAFKVAEAEANDIDLGSVQLTADARETARRITELLEKHREAGLDKPQWAELLASMHYLRHVVASPSKMTKSSVIERLRREKGFEREQMDYAWATLDELGLVQNKVLSRNE